MEIAFPLAALIIAITSLGFGLMAIRTSAARDYVHSLESRIERLERDLESCTRERDRLQVENIELLRKLAGTDGRR